MAAAAASAMISRTGILGAGTVFCWFRLTVFGRFSTAGGAVSNNAAAGSVHRIVIILLAARAFKNYVTGIALEFHDCSFNVFFFQW